MGIYETVHYLLGLSHTDSRAHDFSVSILKRLEEYCEEWKRQTNLAFSLYGTPGESLTNKFANSVKRNFDSNFRDWVTNSFHVDVTEKISAFDKVNIESEFQTFSGGGNISYIELPDMTKNIEALIMLMQYIYEKIHYCEFNLHSLDYCGVCGFEGEIKLEENEEGKLYWVCPHCNNRDMNTLRVIRRMCGYLGECSNGVTQGRLADIKNRVIHL